MKEANYLQGALLRPMCIYILGVWYRVWFWWWCWW